MDDIKTLKNTYQTLKKLGDTSAINFLNRIVGYCEVIEFTPEKTKMMLCLITNILPEPGQKFTDCDAQDEISREYIKKFKVKHGLD